MNDVFLPVSKGDLKKRGWNELDIILISGDAYVDHPSYGPALIGRFLESKGFKVGIISQPDWRHNEDFLKLGKPKLFFGITSGNVDSMIANYTPNKKPRDTDDYSPGGKSGFRPDRAVIVYSNKIKETFKDTPIVLGGIEASLRRFAHYDYWDNCVRRSILVDAKADILVYGMGERQVLEIAERLKNGESVNSLDNIRGTVIVRKNLDFLKDYAATPSFEEIKDNKGNFADAFKVIYSQMNPFTAKPVVQSHDSRFIVNFPPALPLSVKEIDEIYELSYTRNCHPFYGKSNGIKGFETVKHSVVSHRGCCGECSFCSLYFHQGKIIQSRSMESILKEIRLISKRDDFKGVITDIGGPTVNLYRATCPNWEKTGYCKDKKCLMPSKCNNLELGYKECLELYRKAKQIPGVKHIFIGSGLRYDLLVEDYANEYLEEICKFHVSGQIKVAPEHSVDKVLRIMNKQSFSVYEKFVENFNRINKKLKKDLFIVNYLICSHPGSQLKDALELGIYLAKRKMRPQQVQDFTPSPPTLSTCIYWTGTHPFTGEKIYVSKTFKERKMQRALIQPQNPNNKSLILEALRKLKKTDLFNKYFKY